MEGKDMKNDIKDFEICQAVLTPGNTFFFHHCCLYVLLIILILYV